MIINNNNTLLNLRIGQPYLAIKFQLIDEIFKNANLVIGLFESLFIVLYSLNEYSITIIVVKTFPHFM